MNPNDAILNFQVVREPFDEYVDAQRHAHPKLVAGLAILAYDLSRVLVLLRSQEVVDPGLYDFPGGGVHVVGDILENPVLAALREGSEEMGGLPHGELLEGAFASVLDDGTICTTYPYRMHASVGLWVPEKLNWEHCGYRWPRVSSLERLARAHYGVRKAAPWLGELSSRHA